MSLVVFRGALIVLCVELQKRKAAFVSSFEGKAKPRRRRVKGVTWMSVVSMTNHIVTIWISCGGYELWARRVSAVMT